MDRHVFVGKIVVFGKLTEIAWFQKYRLNVKLKVGWKLLRGWTVKWALSLSWLCVIGRPEADLVGNMEELSENPNGVELDDVLLNRNIEEILKNDAWATEAA